MNRLLITRPASARLLQGPTSQLLSSNYRSFLCRFATVDAREGSNESNSSRSSNNEEEDQNNSSSLDAIRSSILKSALKEVHHYGWTEDALAAATTNAKNKQKMSMSVMGMITVDDLIGYCMDRWNLQLREDLQKQQQQENQQSKEDMPSDPLERGLKVRLQYLIPYLESNRWHEGMALGIRGPSNALQTQRQLQEMIDIIAASSSQQQLGAPEKMALGAVYVATELHLLTDHSPDYQDTWAFLSSRMEDWRRLTTLTSSAGGFSSGSNSNGAVMNDTLFVATSVASSLAGGLVSLIMNPSSKGMSASFGLPDSVWTSLFQNQQGDLRHHNQQQQNWQFDDKKTAREQDGSHPDDYNIPPKSSSSSSTK